MPSLKSESDADSILPTNMGDALAGLLENEDYQYKQEVTKGKGRSQKSSSVGEIFFLLKSELLFLIADAWIYHIVIGNDPLSGLM